MTFVSWAWRSRGSVRVDLNPVGKILGTNFPVSSLNLYSESRATACDFSAPHGESIMIKQTKYCS
jgi:hypothetical protein